MWLRTSCHQIQFHLLRFLWINTQEITTYAQNLSLLCEQSHAILLNNEKYVIKICKVQRFPKDYFRKYIGRSQATREYKGAQILKQIGIKTAEPISFSYSLSPFSKIESIYIMSYLNNYLGVVKLQENELHLALELIAKDLKIMRDNSVLFKDLHLNNIMYRDNEIRWIDTDIKIIYDSSEYDLKWNLAIQRMLKPLTSNNQKLFLELLR